MTRNKGLRILILGVLAFLLVPVLAHAQITITFEGFANNEPVGAVDGVVFSPGWWALIDKDAGGTGAFANEPSPSTAVYIPSTTLETDPDRRITFPEPVKSVSFFYSLATSDGSPVVSFYRADGTLLGTAVMDVSGFAGEGADCVGDPDGFLCLWAELTFVSSLPNISYMEFPTTAAGSYVLDDLTLQGSCSSFIRNGFWAVPGEVGGAVTIDIRGNKLAVGWGAYDKETGEPSWMYSDGEMTDASNYTGKLWKFSQGQCFDCPYVAGPEVQQDMGDVTITFHSETSATMSALGVVKNIERVD